MQEYSRERRRTAGRLAASKPLACPGRAQRAAPWRQLLHDEDFPQICRELERLVRSHLATRSLRYPKAWPGDGLDERSGYHDLTQELFVTLLGKARFNHYLDENMTDAEIHDEIGHIELSNILGAELRKRHPETYRLARRIARTIRSSARFKRFDTSGYRPYRRLSNQVYGLSHWPADKRTREAHELEQRIETIPVRSRNIRITGRTGSSQIVIGNAELETLIVAIFEQCDAVIDVRTLRGLVMSRLSLMDAHLVSVDSMNNDNDELKKPLELASEDQNPELSLLASESEEEVAALIDEFLKRIQTAVRHKAKRYQRMLEVLWHCYLSPAHKSQLQVAQELGVSDSLVSTYRHSIEEQLRALTFTNLEEARQFESALSKRIKSLVVTGPAEAGTTIDS